MAELLLAVETDRQPRSDFFSKFVSSLAHKSRPTTCDLWLPLLCEPQITCKAVLRATRNNKSDKYVTCEALPAQRQRLVP